MGSHHKNSPSSMESKENCPCYESSESSSKAADDGTLIHLALEKEDPSILETSHQVKAYENCRIEQTNVEKWMLRDTPRTKLIIRKEVKIRISGKTHGTVDLVILNPTTREAMVMDWKCGDIPVTNAPGNFQIALYAVGVKRRFPSYKTFYGGIIMPRVPDGTSYTRYAENFEDEVLKRFDTVVKETRNPFKKPTLGAHCKYCKNVGACPAHVEVANHVTEVNDLAPIELKSDEIQLLDEVSRGKAMVLAKILPIWASAVKDRCTKLALEHSEESLGFSLRHRLGSVTILDLPQVLSFLDEHFPLITRESILEEAATVSATKLVALLMQHYEGEYEHLKSKFDWIEFLLSELGPDVLKRGHEITYLQKSARKQTLEELADLLSAP